MGKKNLKGASKAAIYRSKVQQTDSLGTSVEEFVFEEGMSLVEQIVGDFIERVQDNISKEKNFSTTGKISDISMEMKDGVLNVYANPHLIYQDRGVNGSKVKKYDTPHSFSDKRPPASVFKEWIKNKQVFLTSKNDEHRKYDKRLSDKEKSEDRPFKELTEDEKIERASWAISTKVFNEGIKPRKIYSKEIPKLIEDLQSQLADFAIQQIQQNITIQPKEGGGNRTIVKK